MNFSFDESGGMGSKAKAHSEKNFNLLCFLVLSSKIINCDSYLVGIFLLETMFRVFLSVSCISEYKHIPHEDLLRLVVSE